MGKKWWNRYRIFEKKDSCASDLLRFPLVPFRPNSIQHLLKKNVLVTKKINFFGGRGLRLGWALWKRNSFEFKFDDTVNSQFKTVHFSFLKSRVVWFKKELCSESKNRSSEKNALFTWICNLRSFLNREFSVPDFPHIIKIKLAP